MNKVHYCIRDDQMLNDNNYITIKILSINRVKEVMQLYFHWVSLIDFTFHIFCITSCCINLIKMLIKWVMDMLIKNWTHWTHPVSLDFFGRLQRIWCWIGINWLMTWQSVSDVIKWLVSNSCNLSPLICWGKIVLSAPKLPPILSFKSPLFNRPRYPLPRDLFGSLCFWVFIHGGIWLAVRSLDCHVINQSISLQHQILCSLLHRPLFIKGCRMGRSDKVSLWYVALLINTRFCFFILCVCMWVRYVLKEFL